MAMIGMPRGLRREPRKVVSRMARLMLRKDTPCVLLTQEQVQELWALPMIQWEAAVENLNFEPPPVASAVPVAVAEVLAPVVVPRGLCTRSRLHVRAVQMYTTWKKKALAPAAEHLGKAPRHAGKAR